jgi:hypothetical protein
MRMPAAALVLATLLAGLLGTGCSRANFTTPERYDRGLVVCLSGAGSMTGECQRIRQGLDAGGVKAAIEIFDWSSGGVIEDQVDVSINHGRALELTSRLESYMAQYPGRPVHVVALSAGTGVAIWATEDLAGSRQIDGVVLMASSLDARYDLTGALVHVRDHIYSFHTVTDAVLAVAVTVTRTVDREGAVAGGLVGFKPPEGATEYTQELYKEKLEQIAWWPTDVIYGNMGDHLGTSSSLFVRARVAPLVLGKGAAKSEQTAPAAPPPEKVGGGTGRAARAETGKGRSTDRFVGWNVGDAAAARPARPEDSAKPAKAGSVDESQFFKGSGDLP